MEKKGLGWINDKTLRKLSTDDIKLVYRYRNIESKWKKKLEENNEEDKETIKKLQKKIKEREEKIKQYKKEQKEIYDKLVQYTNDWFPQFWITFLVKKAKKEEQNTHKYWMCNVKLHLKKTNSHYTKSIHFGNEIQVVKELKSWYKGGKTEKLLTGEITNDKRTIKNRTIRKLLEDFVTDYVWENTKTEKRIEKFIDTVHNLDTVREFNRQLPNFEIEVKLN